jgi:hypothetical protein
MGSNSIKLKDSGNGFNYSTFYLNGDVKQYGCVTKSEELGLGEIGNQYLENLSKIFPESEVNRTLTKWQWRVCIKNKPLALTIWLQNKEKVYELIKRTQIQISEKY